MRNRSTSSVQLSADEALVRTSPDAPSWITSDLIQQTLDCWQPHFDKPLTAADAVEILTSVGQLFDALK